MPSGSMCLLSNSLALQMGTTGHQLPPKASGAENIGEASTERRDLLCADLPGYIQQSETVRLSKHNGMAQSGVA